MPFDIAYHGDEVTGPVLRLPYVSVGGTGWRHVHPPLCPQGHELVGGTVTIGHTSPNYTRFHCWTCRRMDPVPEHNTWYVIYPDWDNERQQWVFPAR